MQIFNAAQYGGAPAIAINWGDVREILWHFMINLKIHCNGREKMEFRR